MNSCWGNGRRGSDSGMRRGRGVWAWYSFGVSLYIFGGMRKQDVFLIKSIGHKSSLTAMIVQGNLSSVGVPVIVATHQLMLPRPPPKKGAVLSLIPGDFVHLI